MRDMREGIVSDVEIAPTVLMSAPVAPSWHQPVMIQEVLDALNPRPGATIVDGTVGTGGHSAMILPRLLPSGTLIAIDRDEAALRTARTRLADFTPNASFTHENYGHLDVVLQQLGLSQVDGVLLDLGMSSVQVDDASRGFSFSKEGPLDMRMDLQQDLTAHTLVNRLSLGELTTMLATLGEERFARRIARHLVEARRAHPITTTVQLAHLVTQAVPGKARYGRLHPATRTFQALRMTVNDELRALETFLAGLGHVLRPGGRAVILTFHSLEDRLVKRAFVQRMREGTWTLLTKKPLRPTPAEVSQNPRARSAKLRAIERTAA